MSRHLSRRQVSVTVDVDIDLEDIDDEDLIEELRERGLHANAKARPGDAERKAEWEELAAEIRDAARSGDWRHLDILLLRVETWGGVRADMILRAAGEAWMAPA